MRLVPGTKGIRKTILGQIAQSELDWMVSWLTTSDIRNGIDAVTRVLERVDNGVLPSRRELEKTHVSKHLVEDWFETMLLITGIALATRERIVCLLQRMRGVWGC
jgi:hypothetical protein